jgi:hypothetical protein
MSKFYSGQRGHPKLGFRGYAYTKASTNVTTQNWRCEENKATKCKGSASTPVNFQDGCQVVELGVHNHVPDPASVELGVKMAETLERAGRGNEPPRRLVSDLCIGLSEEATARAPKRKATTQRIQRKRRKMEGMPPLPMDTSFKIPEKYRTVVHADVTVPFLMHDDADGNDDSDSESEEEVPDDRIIIFASDAFLELLQNATTWIMDGTFKEAPGIFTQLYTIHAVVQDYVFPCVYTLLPNKSKKIYERLFDILKQKRPRLSPRVVILDFEKAVHKALLKSFPGVTIQGCLFHLSQSVWRKSQSLGLKELYINDPNVRRIIKSLPALAFLPTNQVAAAYHELDEEVDDVADGEDQLRVLMDYFEETYVGGMRRGRRREPPFPPKTWSVRQAALDGTHRTQNRIEGWHRAIQTHFDGAHPTVWTFLTGMHREEGLQYAELVRHRAGAPGPKTKKKYQEITRRIQHMVENYETENRKQFLNSLVHNIELNV